jgi:hypothetical protein
MFCSRLGETQESPVPSEDKLPCTTWFCAAAESQTQWITITNSAAALRRKKAPPDMFTSNRAMRRLTRWAITFILMQSPGSLMDKVNQAHSIRFTLAACVLAWFTGCQREPNEATTGALQSEESDEGDGATDDSSPFAEVEVLYTFWGGSNGIVLLDDWIYFQGKHDTSEAVYRAPKRAGSEDELERIGPYYGEGSSRIIATDGSSVYFASYADPNLTTRLYVHDPSTSMLTEIDLGYESDVQALAVGPTHVAVFSANCLSAALIDKRDNSVSWYSPTDGEYLGGPTAAAAVGDSFLCAGSKIWRIGSDQPERWETLSSVTTRIVYDIHQWNDEAMAAVSPIDVNLIALTESPWSVTPLKNLSGDDSRSIHDRSRRTLYWLSRYQSDVPGINKMTAYDTRSWHRAELPLPKENAPSSGITQDEDYLYWGETPLFNRRAKISRSRKLTFEQMRERNPTGVRLAE